MIRESQPPTIPVMMHWALIRANDPMILSSYRYDPIEILNLMSEMIIILNYILNDKDLHCSRVIVGSDEPSCPKWEVNSAQTASSISYSNCDYTAKSGKKFWNYHTKTTKVKHALPWLTLWTLLNRLTGLVEMLDQTCFRSLWILWVCIRLVLMVGTLHLQTISLQRQGKASYDLKLRASVMLQKYNVILLVEGSQRPHTVARGKGTFINN